jgi:tetratricopeptide (TPR) repeat protein
MLKAGRFSGARVSLVSALALGVALGSPGAAHAEAGTAQPTPPPVSAPALAAEAAKTEIDVSALRYYWASGQSARMEAELHRLQRLYPQWTAPAFLQDKPGDVATGGEDELDLWDLFAADKLDELEKAIAQRRRDEPGWEPSAELKTKFAAKQLRLWISENAKSGHFADIVRRLELQSNGLEGMDLDVLWMVAEAYQKSHHSDRALAIYKHILESETDPSKRMATIQKALGGLRMDDFEQLLALAAKGQDGKSEFASLDVDIARARIAAFLHDEREAQVGDDDLKVFTDYARGAKDPNQPALLAWYYYKLRNYPQTLEWFKLGLTRGGDAMVAHGLALTLRFLGLKREAEEVSYAWRAPLVNNSILFIDTLEADLTKPIPPFVEPARLERYAEVTGITASGEGAQALGWYAYNTCQFDVAAQWFARAVAWFPKEQSVYGLALSLRKIKKGREANELINRYDGLFPFLVALLFPDDKPHPPTPCDTQNQVARKVLAPRDPLFAGDGRMAFSLPTFNSAAYGVPAWGRVASPEAMEARGLRARMPRIPRNVFPISVTAENPYRFAPAGAPELVNAPVGADAPADSGGFALDPASPMEPPVARRVPGVGAMPYERYGYALLPGYNGVTMPSASIAVEQTAPAGTLWARELALQPPASAQTAPQQTYAPAQGYPAAGQPYAAPVQSYPAPGQPYPQTYAPQPYASQAQPYAAPTQTAPIYYGSPPPNEYAPRPGAG